MLAAHADEIAMSVNYISEEVLSTSAKWARGRGHHQGAARRHPFKQRRGESVVGNVAPHLMREEKNRSRRRFTTVHRLGAGSRKEAENLSRSVTRSRWRMILICCGTIWPWRARLTIASAPLPWRRRCGC